MPSCIVMLNVAVGGSWKASLMPSLMATRLPCCISRLVVPAKVTWDNHKSDKYESLPPRDVAEFGFLLLNPESFTRRKH